MNERDEDLARLQQLLDTSYAQAGRHLVAIHTPAARLTADALVAAYTGMQVAVVATVASDGRPFTGPVDTFLHRGHLYFGTDASAVRTRHLDRDPVVSITHVRGESLVVTVHGEAVAADLSGTDADFAARTREHYGTAWDEWDPAPRAWWVRPHRMYAADMSVHASA